MRLSALDTSFEAELRALIFLFLLDEPTDVDSLACLGTLTANAHTFGLGETNVNGTHRLASGELNARTHLKIQALQRMTIQGPVHFTRLGGLERFRISDKGTTLVNRLSAQYATDFFNAALETIELAGDKRHQGANIDQSHRSHPRRVPMKTSFWIALITVAGHPTRQDSRIDLTDGLNIVCGPSNTGKSWILQSIDYMFSAAAKEFSTNEQSGYTEVRMGVHTPFGQLMLTRPIGQGHTIVDVTNTDKRIPSGQYRLNKTKNGALLNSLSLRLAGFENPDELKVIKNQNYDVQGLTERTVSHTFYADEDNIIKKAPILLPEQNTAHTAAKWTLAEFITDKDYVAYAREENNETKKLRNNTIIDYLTPKPDELRQRIEPLEAARETSNPDQAQRGINELSAQFAHVNALIENAAREGEQVASRLQEIRDQLAESGTLRHRYEELVSSYQAKIDRSDFVHEGHALTSTIPTPESCPICEQTLPANKTPAVAEPDPRERQNLLTWLDGLRQTISQMEIEHALLVAEEQQLASHSRRITEHIENQLRPQLHALACCTAANNVVVAMQTELEELRERKVAIQQEIAERQAKTFPRGNFSATDEFPESFWETMDESLLDTFGRVRSRVLTARHSHVNCSMPWSTGKRKASKARATARLLTQPCCLHRANTSPQRLPCTA